MAAESAAVCPSMAGVNSVQRSAQSRATFSVPFMGASSVGGIQAEAKASQGQRSRGQGDSTRDQRGPCCDEWERRSRAVAHRSPDREDVLMDLPRSSRFRLVATWLAVAVFFSSENVLVGAARHHPFD